MHRILIAFIATFAVALPVTVLLTRDDGRPASTANPDLPPAPRPSDSTDVRIAKLQATVRAAPLRADGWTLLAGTYLQKVRETGDAGFYLRAQGAVDRALRLRPGDAGALTQRSALELSRHDFLAGLADARRARAAAPTVDQPFGTLVDALVELGRYPQAGRALQEMVDRKPNLAAYARVSYFRELHGDLRGALSAMRAAVSAGGAVPEQDAYVRSLLAGLELQAGQIDAAVRDYRGALAAVPNYPAAEAGLAQTDVARGRFAPAIARLTRLVARLPIPAYVTALGEAQAAAGRHGAAKRSFALVRAEVMLQRRAGVNADVELALFEADHGSPKRAVVLGRRAWAAAPSVRSADALGWALYRAGHARAALGWARRALAIGSRDPAFLAHAGLIARAAGEPALAARRLAGARAGRAALGAGLREALR
ncbi:MAG TPA: tetratricopeptide repeat protein [Solirubrobacteraceae bacterium]|jgi:tetratricopeptide (TPR) repeat protein